MEREECLYRIGELADLSGVSPRTIDYYTQIGLLQPCRRSEGNYRLYSEGALERLRVIKLYQEQGLHLSAIQGRLKANSLGGDGGLEAQLEQLQQLVEQMVRRSAEIAEVKPLLRVAAAQDQQVRMALSRAASDLLQKALLLSTLLASALEEGGVPPIL